MDDLSRLKHLIRSDHPCLWISTHEEAEALEAVLNAAADLQREMHVWSVLDGIRHGVLSDGPRVEDTEQPAAALYHVATRREPAVYCFLDLIDHIGDARVLRGLREAIGWANRSGGTIVLIDHHAEAPAPVRAHATAFTLSMPDGKELETIVRKTIARVNSVRPISIQITRRNLEVLVKNLSGLTRRQAECVVQEATADDQFNNDDLNHVLAAKRRILCNDGLLEFVESPATLDSIGGLARLKKWLKEREDALDPEARDFGLTPPRGVLMLGVQGAGKSLCAKAVATAWGRPLLRLDPSVLYDRFIGESERRLRDALRTAEAMSPIVLWIDEIEKGFASAASHSVDGGLSQRMFGTLLTWMQEHGSPVFLIATANNIEALPPELLRKGRFDEVFFVDLPGEAVRREIFRIHLRKRGREADKFDTEALAKAAEGFSGAEIEQAVVGALHAAFAGRRPLSTAHVLEAVRETRPLSVTMAERVADLRAWARDRCVPAD